jgi:hypothetical protein
MQNSEVKLRADKRYGPDDATLWPQPWVEMFCHLGAIPRKPDDPNDDLSIMWWDPTPDDFQFFGSSTIPSAHHCKMFRPEHSRASARGATCTFSPSFLYGIFPHTLF